MTTGYRGVRGQVKIHRSPSEQKKLSAGTGDDASHQKSNESGGAGDRPNLTRQNPRLNRGEVKKLDNYLSNAADHGFKVRDHVKDVFRPGEQRPFMRVHKYHIYKDGKLVKSGEVVFANTHTPRSRELQGIKDKVSNQKDNVIQAADRFGASARRGPARECRLDQEGRGCPGRQSQESGGGFRRHGETDQAVRSGDSGEEGGRGGPEGRHGASGPWRQGTSQERCEWVARSAKKHAGPEEKRDKRDDE